MTEHATLGVAAARARRTGIRALVVDARPLFGAVAVRHALGPALDVRIAKIVGHARAGGGALALRAQSIYAARTGLAGLRGNDYG